jgi:uncharacterized membrane protein YgcG
MKLARCHIFLSLGAAALFTAGGCSSSSSATTPPTSDASTKNDTGTTGTKDAGHDTATAKHDTGVDAGTNGITGNPPASSGPATTATTPHNLAIHYLYLGDTDPTPALTTDTNAWETFGYNLDGLDSTKSSTNVCTPAVATSTIQQGDGVSGIDNAFGSAIVPNLGTFGISSSEISADIAEGHFTIEFDTVGLSATTPQTNTGLSGQFFAGVKYNPTADAGPPLNGTSFAIADNWPVSGAFLTDPTNAAGGSTVKFPSAYVTDGVWVSGAASGPVPLSLILAGNALTINIHAPIVTAPITVDAAGQFHVKGGIIAGVIDTQELLAGLGPVLLNSGFCSAEGIAVTLIESAQDIILSSDGKTVSNTAGTPCNAISIGLKFDADEIAQPSTAVPVPDAGPPGSCPVDGGSGSGSSSGSSSSSGSGSSSSSGSGSGSSSSSSSGGAG